MQEIKTSADARYTGTSGDIFRLAMVTGFLTLITVGIYRFWAKTRVRRYVWSSTELQGARFEYTGTGLEKFLGFLIAVVIMAVYLGIIQMALFFFGLSLFVAEPETFEQAMGQIAAIYITLFAVLPLIYFAVYRARRYKLARTRWRSIRFGMDKGAWGYSFRAIGYGLLTILTLGILMPLATFRLEKYLTDRSWFGDAKFVQNGRWQSLYPAMKHLAIGLVLVVVAALAGGFAAESGSGGLAMLAAAVGVVGYFWLIIGGVYYTVHSFRYLTANKVLGEDITFEARPTTATILLAYVVGALAIGVLMAIAFGILAMVVGIGFAFDLEGADVPGIGQVTIGAVGYIAILIAAGAGWLAMVVQPIIAHYVDTMTVNHTEALNEIAQRASDTGADAEGFADALDIGGAI